MGSNALRITDLVWTFLKPVIRPGDTVMDATAGNGNDTVGLAECVGETGKVLAFDIQKIAIEKTEALLLKNGLSRQVELILDDHGNFEKYFKNAGLSSFKAVMINLGYLPGGSRDLVTKTETSLRLLGKCLQYLEDDGMITVCLYPGHPEGEKETATLLAWAKKLDSPFIAHHFKTLNRHQPPSLLIIQKMRVS